MVTKALSKTAVNLGGMTGEQMAQTLVSQGWTWDQVRSQYPELFGTGGGTIPTGGTTSLTPETPQTGTIPADILEHERARGEELATTGGDLLGSLGQAIPPAVATLAASLGIPVAALGALYGITQMIGVQYPWETGPGEGFIAPWTRDIVQDEQGKWVTRETRPDLFNGGGTVMPGTAAVVPMGQYGPSIVKTWTANGWPFAMDSNGRIYTVKKNGQVKSWKPYRSVVLGKNPSTRQLNGAMRKLEAFDKTHERIKKLARRLKT